MKDLVCNYALVRFLPYRETGEFVNVGVLLYAPEINYFDYRLARKRNHRVRTFFPELSPDVYAAAIESMRSELQRQKSYFEGIFGPAIQDRAVSEGLTIFRAMLNRRESLLHYAEPGMKLGPPEEMLNRLFDNYVSRSFAVTPTYQETVMKNRVHDWLVEWGLLARYKANKYVGDSMFRVVLPFVHFEGENATAAIKPLDLNRNNSTDVFDHGGLWLQRFRRLSIRKQLPQKMLVPVFLPAGSARMAADEVAKELSDIGIRVTDFNDVSSLRTFANV